MKKDKLVWDDTKRADLRKEKEKFPSTDYWRPEEMKLELWISKQGRGGKSVTLIKGLNNNPEELKHLAKTLKNKFPCGGTIKLTEIEIQNDNRIKIKEFLENMKFIVKICGG